MMVSRRGVLLSGLTLITSCGEMTKVEAETAASPAVIQLAAEDSLPDSLRLADALASRLGGDTPVQSGREIQAQPSRGVLDSAGRLADRSATVAAILPSTALSYLEQHGAPGSTAHANRYIAQLGVLELHLLTSRRIAAWPDLAGQTVSLGPPGSATEATASVLLEGAPVRLDRAYGEAEQALEAVLRGQLAGMFLLGAAPDPLLQRLTPADGVHVLPLALTGARQSGVFRTQIPSGVYGFQPGEAVGTPGVPLLLACFGWSPVTPMHKKLAVLANRLAERGSGLRGFDMGAAVQGWERFQPVADWLARGRNGPIRVASAASDRAAGESAPVARSAPPAPSDPAASDTQKMNDRQKEKLFQQFLDWQRRQ